MLWQKESNAKDALYIDLCKPPLNKANEFKKEISFFEKQMLNSVEQNFIPDKDNSSSWKLRKDGNALFAEKKWDQAMDKYNRSLCLAENDSQDLALAYANRSSCYLRMKMYEKCLIDIDLAMKANYPKYLQEKLDKRVSDCSKSIADGVQAVNREAELSCESHPDHPAMANHLVIVGDTKYGRGVLTSKDIDVGETVLMEPMYIGESYVRKYETCTVCLKGNTNLVPCKTCTFAMLCYDGCKNADLHRVECGIRKRPITGEHFSSILIPIIRSIMMAAKLFPNPFDLLEFVEDAIASDPMEIPTTSDDKSTYRAFLKAYKKKQEAVQVHPSHIHFIYKSLPNNTELAAHFSTEKYRRFLMHLIVHHLDIFASNMIMNVHLGDLLTGELHYVVEDKCLSILKTYFNHSCAPNITFYCDNGYTIAKTTRPVRSGDQLFVSYFEHSTGATLEDRRTRGRFDFDFECACVRCASGVDDNTTFYTPDDADLMFRLDYFYIQDNFHPRFYYPNESQRETMEKKSLKLLKEIGRKKWSFSLEYIMEAYATALMRSSTSPIPKYHYMTNIVKSRPISVSNLIHEYRRK